MRNNRLLSAIIWVLVPLVAGAQPVLAGHNYRHRAVSLATGLVNPLLQEQVVRIEKTGHHFLRRYQSLPLVHVEVTSTQDVASAIRAVGGTVEADIKGRVIAAAVPADQIDTLAGTPGVVEIYPSYRLHPALDQSVPDIRANQAWRLTDSRGLPVQGNHVLIGIVDTGIDFHNPDFSNRDGSTRIKYIWDQTRDGHAPSGYNFGYECDSASISAGQCPEKDADSHGTHVSGIAAGNGASSFPPKEIGVAPQADIIVVKSDLTNDHIIAAWKYLVDKAQQLGEPISINSSFGAEIGPHDGTEPDSLAVDALSGPGRIFVAAAGNDGNQDTHTDGTISQGGTAAITAVAHGGGASDLSFGVFYSQQDQLSAHLQTSLAVKRSDRWRRTARSMPRPRRTARLELLWMGRHGMQRTTVFWWTSTARR